MVSLVITVLRYLFLILLYLFIFRVTAAMLQDLHGAGQPIKLRNPLLPEDETGEEGTAQLKVIASKDAKLAAGTVFRLGTRTKIGRGNVNQIVLGGSYASYEHCEIVLHQGQYWLEDLSSLNGTFLNDVPLEAAIVLANGDNIRIGDVTFLFVRWAYEMESDNGRWLS